VARTSILKGGGEKEKKGEMRTKTSCRVGGGGEKHKEKKALARGSLLKPGGERKKGHLEINNTKGRRRKRSLKKGGGGEGGEKERREVRTDREEGKKIWSNLKGGDDWGVRGRHWGICGLAVKRMAKGSAQR